MKSLYSFLDAVRDIVKGWMTILAKSLNEIFKGKLSPLMITLISLFMHVPIAWLIAQGYFGYAAVLLAIFGLFDALDGALARVQGSASSSGMLTDSVTDKMKEVILYIGVSFAFVDSGQSYYAVWAVAACGASLLVSYVNAWGEVVMTTHQTTGHTVNASLRGSLMRYEVRMFVLIAGLLINRLSVTVAIIAVLAWFTATERLLMTRKKLRV